MAELMRAAVYRGRDDIRIEMVPIPEIGDGEVLVRLDSCGVCGTDLKKIHHGLVPPPRIFGHEMAGEIAAVGRAVRKWRVGDRVAVMHHIPCLECHYCRQKSYSQCARYKATGTTAGFEPAGGGFAEYIRVMDWIVESGMVRVPEDRTYEEAAFIEPVNTCLKGVNKAGLGPGQTVFIIGLGQIGLIFVQLSRLNGAEVIGSDPIYYRRRRAIQYGAAEAYDPSFANVLNEIRVQTCGRGVDVAIVATANAEIVNLAFDAVRPGGKVLLFAQTRMGEQIPVDAGAICMLEKDLIGSYSSDIDLQNETARLIFERRIDVSGLISHRFPLERIRAAVRLAGNPTDRSLKVMVKPQIRGRRAKDD